MIRFRGNDDYELPCGVIIGILYLKIYIKTVIKSSTQGKPNEPVIKEICLI